MTHWHLNAHSFVSIYWNRKIKRTRENFDHKIAQSTAVIKDYVECIKYDQTLITTIKERAKEKKSPAIHTILTSIADHIKVIYVQALSKFPNNLRFWDEYIKFLHTAKFTTDISVAFEQMLQVCLFNFNFLFTSFMLTFDMSFWIYL